MGRREHVDQEGAGDHVSGLPTLASFREQLAARDREKLERYRVRSLRFMVSISALAIAAAFGCSIYYGLGVLCIIIAWASSLLADEEGGEA